MDVTILRLHRLTAVCSKAQRTVDFYTKILGLRLVKRTVNFDDPTAQHFYFAAGDATPGTIVTYFAYPAKKMRAGHIGAGMTHHLAFAAENDEIQRAWRDRLMTAGIPVTPVLDRSYFKSIYFNDPDGHILEIATSGPGFLIDEDREYLGRSLRLPPWLEASRAGLERTLAPLHE